MDIGISAESIFGSAELEVVVPDRQLSLSDDLPVVHEAEALLEKLASVSERSKAIFDERLSFLVKVKVDHEALVLDEDDHSDDIPNTPPPLLLNFLYHLHVSVDASYIPPIVEDERLPIRTTSIGRLSAQTRTSSLKYPQTPQPTPFTRDADKRYVYTEGARLTTIEWGKEPSSDDVKASFALAFDKEARCWVALYKLAVLVSFFETRIASPLLALTASATLRSKTIPKTSQTQQLLDLIESSRPLPDLVGITDERSANAVQNKQAEQTSVDSLPLGLFEGNLLRGLASDPTFLPSEGSNSLSISSSRLGTSLRHDLFSLPPLHQGKNEVQASNAPRTLVLTKSFRRVLQTGSASRVRLRNVLVPHVFDYNPNGKRSHVQQAGNEEYTVILCVEIENSGESGDGILVEDVRVIVSGEGTKAHLVGWNEDDVANSSSVFPLTLRADEQYNLHYAVSFMRLSDSQSNEVITRGIMNQKKSLNDFQRNVTIHVKGRPFRTSNESPSLSPDDGALEGTSTFTSRWNTLLDFSPNSMRNSVALTNADEQSSNVLPVPPSPFPSHSATPDHLLVHPGEGPPSLGSRRHTLGNFPSANATATAGRPNYRYSATSSVLQSHKAAAEKHLSLQSLASSNSRPSSIQSIPEPSSPPLPALPVDAENSTPTQNTFSPRTPLHPTVESIHMLQQQPFRFANPQQTSHVGPSVDASRERVFSPGVPAPNSVASLKPMGVSSVPHADMVISTSIVPSRKTSPSDLTSKIHQLDEFVLSIFVFNRSLDVKRLEVSYPHRKGDKRRSWLSDFWDSPAPGILALENRVRVGPLLPTASQSVTMRFLALSPGIHSIDSLIITDVATGYTVNLRSVGDIVVHGADG